MRRVLCASLVFAASTLAAQEASELIVEQHPFALHSAFWPNLHQALWAESNGLASPPGGNLGSDERETWNAAVAYYKEEIADLHPLFEMAPIRRVLLSTKGEVPATGLQPAHHDALVKAAAVYRKHWWSAHDRANRAWLVDPLAKVATLSPAVPDRLAKLFGTPWHARVVRVDVVPVSSREGAFSSLEPPPAYIMFSSANPVLTGWTAAEIMFHEASHPLFLQTMQAFGAEAKAQGKNTRDLWHVAMFFMTGEVVRQALAARGITYEPYLYSQGLFDRAWPQFKGPIETHWRAFVDGKTSREEAIKAVVAAVK